jgi:DinB family protein
MATRIDRPGMDEYAEFHKGYMAAVANESDALAVLEQQQPLIERLAHLTPEQSALRYADGKWSVKEITGHLSDSERVLAYRLLRIARIDQTPLPGFDENAFAAGSNADRRTLADLAAELAAVRVTTLALVRSLDEDALLRRGTVNNWTLSARALAFIIAGHFQHHVNILRERYGIAL